jgi:hypothetical protein
VPVSVKSFGRLGAPAYALLCRVADGGGLSKAVFIESALQELSITVCKGMHLSQVAQASGRAYLRRLPVPVADVLALERYSDVGRLYI